MKELTHKLKEKSVGADASVRPFFKGKPKCNRGITLIALIITIIVMLILVGVTVSFTIGENGILSQAKQAKVEQDKATEKEELIIEAYATYGKEAKFNKSKFKLAVEEKDYTFDEATGKITTPKGNTFYINEQGEIADELTEDVFIMYIYNAMYNTAQPEIVPVNRWYDDENGDRISDVNNSLAAYYREGEFNIPVSFFEQEVPEGNIDAIITDYDGTEQAIVLTTNNNKTWTYNYSGKYDFNDECTIEFHKEYDGSLRTDSKDYHYLDLGTSTVMPFHKLNILGTELEFTFNCQAMPMCVDMEKEEIKGSVYKNVENVNKITVNFSKGTKKEYTKEEFLKLEPSEEQKTKGYYIYSSVSQPIIFDLYRGFVYINVANGCYDPITSIIVEENGAEIKYNVIQSVPAHPGD